MRLLASLTMALFACREKQAPPPPSPQTPVSAAPIASASAPPPAASSVIAPAKLLARLTATPGAKGRAQIALVAKEVGLDEKVSEISDPWACAPSIFKDRTEISCTPFPRTPILTLRVVGDDLVIEREGKQVGKTPLGGRTFEVEPKHAGPRQLAPCDAAIAVKPKPIELQTYHDQMSPPPTSQINIIAGAKLVEIGKASTGEQCFIAGDRIECDRKPVCTITLDDRAVSWDCDGARGAFYTTCDLRPTLADGKIRRIVHYY
jgi:hypothetical protein